MSKPEYETLWPCGRPMGPYQGKFPLGLLNRINDEWGIYHHETLFPFGGATPDRSNWVINDINEDLDVDTHHDATNLPDEWENKYPVVASDPPYSEDYAHELYDVEYANPKSHFTEAVRVCEPGGYVLILDWLVYKNYKPETVHRDQPIAVTCGPNTRIRILNVFQKSGEKTGWFNSD